MLKNGLAIAATLASGMLLSTQASAQQACTIYTVKPGDALSTIARTAYGSISFQLIWDANRAAIGPNPNRISVGLELKMPCADGTLPGTAPVVTKAVAKPEDTLPTPQPAVKRDLSIRLVTASDYPPLTQEDMPGGGIYTQLVQAALDTMDDDTDTGITFVNDWGSHLETLLPAGAFDGAFPWLVPNCSEDGLSENSTFRCTQFLHSDPFVEIVTGFFSKAGSSYAFATDYSQFKGLTFCFAEGYTDAPLANGGLSTDDVTIVRKSEPVDCLAAVVDGEADIAPVEVRQAEAIAQNANLADQISLNETLTQKSTLAVYVHKSNPDGPEIIEALNEGLSKIQSDGSWFRILQSGMHAFYTE